MSYYYRCGCQIEYINIDEQILKLKKGKNRTYSQQSQDLIRSNRYIKIAWAGQG